MDPSKHPWLSLNVSLVILLFCSSFRSHVSFAASTISSNQSLSGDQTISSKNGNFELGFFSPGNSSSQKYYIGIWYKKISKKTAVWVANRETPLLDPSSSELKISDDRNLVLLSQSKAQIWSTNVTSFTSNSPVAELLDSGNLVLRDASNSSKVFWQSIDHPTDTWLPGGKLSLNKATGVSQRLISWKNSEDPAPGIYSLEIDPSGASQYLIQWNRSITYWSSGTWNGRIFRDVPEMTSNFIYDFQYVNNTQENYFTYSVKDNSITTRFVMALSGQITQQTWIENSQQWLLFWSQPRAQCDVYSLCGPFGSCNETSLPYCSCVKDFTQASPKDWNLSDLTAGCVRNTSLLCATTNNTINKDQDRFYTMSNVRLPVNPQTLAVGSADQCESSCLGNCSCTAYSFNSGCSVWYGDLLNLEQLGGGSDGNTLFLRLAASELPITESKKWLVIVVVIAAAVLLIGLVGIFWVLIWRHRKKRFRALKVTEGILVPFRYSDLKRVTKNFSEKLGGGGFGSVFKGILPDSTPIAVKKLEGVSQGEKQFRTEVSTIGTIRHINLVRLCGFCSEGTTRLLVYDYMPRGSLDALLFQNSCVVLDWKTRYQVALGTARGLYYLHEKCRDCIIHCDIKPENILLDDSFVPKVADFGLAKLLGHDFSRVLTTMRGTRGYLAPEWITGVAVTVKADVYSYGMMLFEIISGRRNSEHSEGKSSFFPSWAANKLIEGDIISIMDPRVAGDVKLEELDRACKIACWCIQDDEMHRPSMGQIVQILEGLVDVNMPPMPRSLQLFRENGENIVFFSDSSSNQMPSSTSTGRQTTTTTSSSSKD